MRSKQVGPSPVGSEQVGPSPVDSKGWRTVPCGARGRRVQPFLAAEGGGLTFAEETPLSRVSVGLMPSAAWGSQSSLVRLWVPWAPPDLRLPLDVGVVSGEDAGLPPGGSWAQGRSPEVGAIPGGVTPSCLQLQGRRVPPSSPWSVTGLASARRGPGLCPVCAACLQQQVRLPSAWGPGRERLPPAGRPEPLALACGLPALRPPSWCAASRGRGGSTSGKPCPAAAGCPRGQGAKGVLSFCWVAPAGKAAQAETGAQISAGHTGPGPPSGPFCT